MSLETASIGADNTFSGAIGIQRDFNFSLSGTWVAAVTLQRSFDGGSTWLDVEQFTANTERVGNEPESIVQYRFGVKTGDYSSGTVVGRISK